MELTITAVKPLIKEMNQACKNMDASRYINAWYEADRIFKSGFERGLYSFCADVQEMISNIQFPSPPSDKNLDRHLHSYLEFVTPLVQTFETNDSRIDVLSNLDPELDVLLSEKIDPSNIDPAHKLGRKLPLIARHQGEYIAKETLQTLLRVSDENFHHPDNQGNIQYEKDQRNSHLSHNLTTLWKGLLATPTFSEPLPDSFDERFAHLYAKVSGHTYFNIKSDELDQLLSMNMRKSIGEYIFQKKGKGIDVGIAMHKLDPMAPRELMAFVLKHISKEFGDYQAPLFEALFNHPNREATEKAMKSLRLASYGINYAAKSGSNLHVLIDHLSQFLKDRTLNVNEAKSLEWLFDGLLEGLTKERRSIEPAITRLHDLLTDAGINMTHQLVCPALLKRRRKLLERDLAI